MAKSTNTIKREYHQQKMNQYKEIDILTAKLSKYWINYYRLMPFKQPVAWILRRDGTTTYQEGVKDSELTITHTNGQQVTIYIGNTQPYVAKYGKETFKVYFLHEDHFRPLPQDPIIDAETLSNVIRKTSADVEKFKLKQMAFKKEYLKYIVYGIIGIILAYAVYKMLIPQETITNTVQIINLTN